MAQPLVANSAKLAQSNKTKNTYFRYMNEFGYLLVYSPNIVIADDNKQFLISQSNYIQLDPIYYQRPDLMSFDLYGTSDLWYILLHINDIPSMCDFTTNFIYVPPMTAVFEFLKDYIPDRFKTIQQKPIIVDEMQHPLILSDK